MQNLSELQNAKERMQQCQINMGFVRKYGDVEYSTCEPCEKFLECDIRNKYVDLVYSGMNSDTDGGFEF